jgi:hypothetical protein
MSSVLPGFQGLPAFAQVYNTANTDIAVNANFTFNNTALLNGFTFNGTDTLTSQESGVFYVTWVFTCTGAANISLLQNGAPVTQLSYSPSVSSYGTTGFGLVSINKNDTFKLRNDGPAPFDIPVNFVAGYTNASMIFMQIGNHS